MDRTTTWLTWNARVSILDFLRSLCKQRQIKWWEQGYNLPEAHLSLVSLFAHCLCYATRPFSIKATKRSTPKFCW